MRYKVALLIMAVGISVLGIIAADYPALTTDDLEAIRAALGVE